MGGDSFTAYEGKWVPTPGWHPYCWIGYAMRRWCWTDDGYSDSYYDGHWQYGTHQDVAREHLRSKFG